MSDALNDEQLKRLEDLAALRDRGVLSEREFQRAKQRLLGEAPSAARRGSAVGSSFMEGRWRWVVIGTGALLLVLLLWLLLGRQEEDEGVDYAIATGAVNGLASAIDGEALCAAQASHNQLKDFIFTQAITQLGAASAPLASLQQSVGVRMEYPLFRSASQDGGRVGCSGRLIIDLPPTVRKAFEGAPALEADALYTLEVQNGAVRVVEANGTAYTIQRLVTAAAMAGEAQSAGEAPKAAKPSFDCTGDITEVEQMICEDAGLARLDRDLSARYGRLTEDLTAEDLEGLQESQRSFIQRRSECTDAACVKDVYGDRLRALESLAPSPVSNTL